MERRYDPRVWAGAWQRFSVLVRHLPRDSAVNRAVYGEVVAWGAVEHLLADLRDLLIAANWQRSGDPKIPRPEPIPRPGMRPQRDERKTELTQEQINQRLLEQLRRRKGGAVNGDRTCDRLRQPGPIG